MDSDLSLEFLRVVEQAAIACAHTMGQGDRHRSDQVAVEAMRARHGHRADRRHDRHRRRRARRGADALHRREGRHGARARRRGRGRRASTQVDIAVDPLEGTNLCATGAPNAIAVLAASEQRRPAARARSLHGEAGRRSELEGRTSVSTRRWTTTSRRSPGASAATSKIWSSSCSIGRATSKLIADIRATGARIRLIGDGDLSAGIAAAVVGSRRARGDGHRRRARRRADGGGDALPERRNLRAAGRQQARARGALPRDGHHGLQASLSRRRIWRPASEIIFAATGVTDGTLMRGVRFFGDGMRTSSVIMQNDPHQIRFIDSIHVARQERRQDPVLSAGRLSDAPCRRSPRISRIAAVAASEAGDASIRRGGIVAMPTDTLYGLAADPVRRRGGRARLRGQGPTCRARAAAR